MQNDLEKAILSFEYFSGLSVAVHDLTGIIRKLLPQERFSHKAVLCRCVKNHEEKRCVDFDINVLQREVWKFHDGVFKICHGGLLEWVMPLADSGKQLGIIFAGSVIPPSQYQMLQPQLSDVDFLLKSDPDFNWEKAKWVMELLRQLAVTIVHDIRLQKEQLQQIKLNRKEIIHRFIGEYCDRKDLLERLAKKLYLSKSRTIHTVREETGYTFMQLHQAYRMRLAAARLRFSNESVAHIAALCGFDNVASLHRNFKKYFHVTPLTYRKLCSNGKMPTGKIVEIDNFPGRPR